MIVTGIGIREDYKNDLKSHLKAFEYSARDDEPIDQLERKLKELQSGR